MKSGDVFGYWTLERWIGPAGKWLCQCRCGSQNMISETILRNVKRGCKLCRGSEAVDSIKVGAQFGKWTVLERVAPTGSDAGRIWKCRCECGEVVVKSSHNMLHINPKHGGCRKCWVRNAPGRYSTIDRPELLADIAAGKTFQEVADAHGISKQRAAQLFDKLATDAQKAERSEARVTMCVRDFDHHRIAAAAKRLGIEKKRTRRKFIYSADEVERIKAECLADAERRKVRKSVCRVCGKPIPLEYRTGTHSYLVCSDECQRETMRQSRQRLLSGQQKSKTKVGSVPYIAKEVCAKVPPGKQFIRFREAVRLAGVSDIRVSWLRSRGIIGCIQSDCPHTVTGEPTWLYSKDQIRAIGKAYRDYHRGKR